MDPPISVPHPNMLPLQANRAPSPPEDPPGERFESFGFVVRPHSGLSVSAHFQELVFLTTMHILHDLRILTMMLCGRFDFAITMAPSRLRICMIAASSVAGLSHRPT